MLRTKDIMSCLPLLACILGKQYNITVEIGGTTAYTNGKTIHIPSLKIDTDEMYINMTRGYVDHEAAHIRYTDFQLLQSVFGNFSFYSYKKACGQKKTVRGSKNSRRLSNGTPAI